MNLWLHTSDTPRTPDKVSPGERVDLVIGSWPVEPGQRLWIDYRRRGRDGEERQTVEAAWLHNTGGNSYWSATIGPFIRGDVVEYRARGGAPSGGAETEPESFRVGARLHLALLWHQHQPLYKDLWSGEQRGSYRQPWVRLHACRDYYAMAALLDRHPGIHLTINLTPVLLWQLEDYTERGATDRALELTLTPAEELEAEERLEVIDGFFDADWHRQVFPHARYRELFELRAAGASFGPQDLRDLQMWFNLAWFGQEFRVGEVDLLTGERASVGRFVAKGRNFTHEEVQEAVAEQRKVMRAVVPLHRELQDRGQIEISTSPYYHPILPLLIDSDEASLDRPGGRLPPRFSFPQDAQAQVSLAVDDYRRRFGRSPRGIWPAEGAVSRSMVPMLADAGIDWMASDQGVLARSGLWGYEADDPQVLCRPYRLEEAGRTLSIFFRDTRISDEIGFHYQGYGDGEAAARDFLRQLRQRFADAGAVEAEPVVTVVLDGENAWGAYPDDARPFLHALYRQLEDSEDVVTVTFSECLSGAPARDMEAHPLSSQERLHLLHTGSWIDEHGSDPGVDLGTWIGEGEENRAWQLLLEARHALAAAGASPETHPEAFQAIYAAQGSDWFWWFGEDQDSGADEQFDELFRGHLRGAYRSAGLQPPERLARPLVARRVSWTAGRELPTLLRGDSLTVQANCPGLLEWRFEAGETSYQALRAVGGVMAGVQRHQATVGPFTEQGALVFRYLCTHPECERTGPCGRQEENVVRVLDLGAAEANPPGSDGGVAGGG
ncbi:MAG TPA: glycoside hydrolase family 57 protein [Trueperaceae bacterium]|jgi:alpha-amylase/alpha-mannosidase (GH57 family)